MWERPFFIRAEWDEDAQVWTATSEDVPGLATEGSSLEALIEKLKVMIPELLEANEKEMGSEIPFEVFIRRFEVAQRSVT
jgi:predicted RNase H-like HicB family nuclease